MRFFDDLKYDGPTTVEEFFTYLKKQYGFQYAENSDFFIQNYNKPVELFFKANENSVWLTDKNLSFECEFQDEFAKKFRTFIRNSNYFNFITTYQDDLMPRPLFLASRTIKEKNSGVIYGGSLESLQDDFKEDFFAISQKERFDYYDKSISSKFTTDISDAICFSLFIEKIKNNANISTKEYIPMTVNTIDAKGYTTTNVSNSIKETKNMSNDLFNFNFGPVSNNSARLSALGLALKNGDGKWVSYNKSTDEIVDCSILNFSGADKIFYKIPCAVSSIAVGDVVVHNHKAMFVTSLTNGVEVVDVSVGERKTIIPTKSPFGFDFVTKIVSLVDFSKAGEANANNPFGNLLPFLLLGENSEIDPLMFMALSGSGANGFDMSNPLMMYALLGKGGNLDNALPFLLMGNADLFGTKN